MEVKTIREHINSKSTFGDILRDLIKLDWVFSKYYEKIIVIVSILWFGWSIIMGFLRLLS